MSNMSKQKGKRGENAAMEILQDVIDNLYMRVNREPPQLTANRNGWKQGRHDVVGFRWLALEVKNVENDKPAAIGGWWDQCKEQAAMVKDSIPVLMYKRNNREFRIRMRGNVRNIDGTMFTTVVDISQDSFLVWFAKEVTKRMAKEMPVVIAP